MEVNLSYLKGVRTRYRNTLERAIQDGENILSCDVSSFESDEQINKIGVCSQKIKTYIDKLEVQTEKVVCSIDESDSDYLELVLEEVSVLQSEAMDCHLKLQQLKESLMSKKLKEEVTSHPTEQVSAEHLLQINKELQHMLYAQMEQQTALFEKQSLKDKEASSAVRLPKLDISPFSGDKLKWLEFWDSFTSSIHENKKLSDIEKFTYLRSKLNGEALRSISGIHLSGANYLVAIKTLNERFGNSQEVIDLHYNELINLKCVDNTTQNLRFFNDKIDWHLRSLEVLDQNVNQAVFVSIVKSKLPKEVLFQLELKNGTDGKWTIQKLREHLSSYIIARERSQTDNSQNAENVSRSKKSNDQPKKKPKASYNNNKPSVSSSEALVANTNTGNRKSYYNLCRYCEMEHWSDECPTYTTIDERKRHIQGSCYKCLKVGHMARKCKSNKTCVHCGEVDSHHRSLCPKKFGTVSPAQLAQDSCLAPEQNTTEKALISSGEMVLMQTALTEVNNPHSALKREVRILLDSGSQRTYITEDLARKLGLKSDKEEQIKLVTFGSDRPTILKTKVVKILLKLNNGSQMELSANVVPVISGTVSRKAVKVPSQSQLEHLLNGVKLSDTLPKVNESSTVELLIGNDYYLDIILSQKMEVQPGLYLLASKLGWILTGRTRDSERDIDSTSMLILTHGTNITKTSVYSDLDPVLERKPDIEDFWNIESIGVKDNVCDSEDEIASNEFKRTLKFENGRYQVTWPWKSKDPELPRNRELAVGRLRSVVSKLKNKPEVLKQYNTVIEDQLEKGVIEKVDSEKTDGPIHYLPHHAVINPTKPTTKLRVVYDASAKTNESMQSLNECLYRGPVMLHDLCGILMRFRLNKIALVADIEKAFLQVGLQQSERDVTRFVWLKDHNIPTLDGGNMQEYRFCRVPFGVISSPFLLGAVIDSHLDSYQSEFCDSLKQNIYVDNLITGVDSNMDAFKFYTTSKQIFSEASMNLREWISNEENVNEFIPMHDRAQDCVNKVLGLSWDSQRDTLSIRPLTANTSLEPTKRNILKTVAQVFDPLGLFAPVLLRGKLLLQELWINQVDWDDKLSNEIVMKWNMIRTDIERISEYELSRYIGNSADDDKDIKTQYILHCFCDASKHAYACSLYLQQIRGDKSCVNLVFSKTRLAPIKGMTIPRLELMAVLIGVRCVKFVKSQLGMEFKKVYLWSDSQCVLKWIESNKSLSVFVQNRVKEIKDQDFITYKYIQTHENPADVASRGATVQQLCDDENWWHGPKLLEESESHWPSHENKDSDDEKAKYESEIRANKGSRKEQTEISAQVSVSEKSNEMCIDINKYSSFTKLIRVTALVLRFIRKLKKQKVESEHLTSDELQRSEDMWIQNIQHKHFSEVFEAISKNKPHNLQKQLGIFVDEKGILRCKGRLEFSCLSEGARQPILLPTRDPFTSLLINKTHEALFHSGVSQTLSSVRMKYWILQGRSAVRSVLRQCHVCRRHEGGPYKLPKFSPLPSNRVTESTAFSRTGVDYFGPIYVKSHEGPKKVWVCLFTCLVTRAVHLELVQDMTSAEFLMCLKRFISQRGAPVEILSDNAKQFKAADTCLTSVWKSVKYSPDVQNYISSSRIKWTFTVEMAPWMGGTYERLVGVVKRNLRKALGKKLLSFIQLQTLLKEIEAVVNSRPLAYVGDDINSTITLTPAHFLTLNPRTGIPESEDSDGSKDPDYTTSNNPANQLLRIWKKGQIILNSFWRLWRNEYLTSLRERTQSHFKHSRNALNERPKEGDVVLIKDESPRGCWRMGKITEIRQSKDGEVRSARVLLASGRLLSRPINLLYPIETSCENELREKSENMHYESTRCEKRPKRQSAITAETNIRKMLCGKGVNID